MKTSKRYINEIYTKLKIHTKKRNKKIPLQKSQQNTRETAREEKSNNGTTK